MESLICLPKASSRIWLEEKQCSKKIISMQKRSKTSFLVMKQKTFSFWSFYDWFTFWFLEVAKSQLLRVFASWRIFMVAFQSPCSNNLPYRKKVCGLSGHFLVDFCLTWGHKYTHRENSQVWKKHSVAKLLKKVSFFYQFKIDLGKKARKTRNLYVFTA